MDESRGRFKFNFDKRGLQASFNFRVKDTKRGRRLLLFQEYGIRKMITLGRILPHVSPIRFLILSGSRLLDCSLKRVMLHCIKPINSTYTSLIFPIFARQIASWIFHLSFEIKRFMALNVAFPIWKGGSPTSERHFIVRCIEYQGFFDELMRRKGMQDFGLSMFLEGLRPCEMSLSSEIFSVYPSLLRNVKYYEFYFYYS